MKEPWKGNKPFHRVQYAAVSPQPIHPLSPPTAAPPSAQPIHHPASTIAFAPKTLDFPSIFIILKK